MSRVLITLNNSQSANGQCASAVVEELINQGNEVFCLVNEEKDHKELKFSKAKVYSVKPRLSTRWLTQYTNSKNFLGKIRFVIARYMSIAKYILMTPLWPLQSFGYLERYYKKAKKVVKKENIDIIVSIYVDIESLITGYYVKKKYPDIIYIPYLLDAFSGGGIPKYHSRKWTAKKGIRWEKKCFSLADQIIIMKSGEKYYFNSKEHEKFKEKMIVLDIPLLRELSIEKGLSNLKRDKINLVFVGSIPIQVRNPFYFLSILERIDNKQTRLYIIGNNNIQKELEEWSEKLGKDRLICYPFMDHDECMHILADADVLVNFGNNISTMVPSKIFEYMSFRKPIISTAPNFEEPSVPYLKKYKNAEIIYENENMLNQNIELINNFLSKVLNEKDKNQFNTVEMYYNTPSAFVDVIDKLSINRIQQNNKI